MAQKKIPAKIEAGIDENTAVVVEGERLRVIGKGAVYVFDGSQSSYSNLGEDSTDQDQIMSVFDVKLHVLSAENQFDLRKRRPEMPPKPEEVAERKSA